MQIFKKKIQQILNVKKLAQIFQELKIFQACIKEFSRIWKASKLMLTQPKSLPVSKLRQLTIYPVSKFSFKKGQIQMWELHALLTKHNCLLGFLVILEATYGKMI